MAAKLLHSLADENPDLQKQIGCMTGIFQVFDRHHVLTGRRISHKRLPSGNSNYGIVSLERQSNNVHYHQTSTEMSFNKSANEKQRLSTESSRASFSSACSSSASSVDFEKASHQEVSSASRDPPTNHNQSATSPRLGRLSLDLREVVKDAMYRETTRGLSVKAVTREESTTTRRRDSPRPLQVDFNEKQTNSVDLKESLRVLAKLREAPWYYNDTGDAPRFSFESRESLKSTAKLKEFPRLSLDGRESSMIRSSKSDSKSFRGSRVSSEKDVVTLGKASATQKRPPSVVAKLMGLDALPDSAHSENGESLRIGNESHRTTRTLNSPSGSSVKEPSSPKWKNPDLVMKPISISRFPIEAAPWNKASPRASSSSRAAAKASSRAQNSFPSVYSEIEKRLDDLEFKQSGKDLRALKQILEAMQAKGFLETRREEQTGLGERNQTKILGNASTDRRSSSSSNRTYESPIVIMKPANKMSEKPGPHNGRTAKDNFHLPKYNVIPAHSSSTSSPSKSQQKLQPNNANSAKSSGSVSPRLQKKLEMEKRARPPTAPSSSSPSKPRRQSSSTNGHRQATESGGSPGGRSRKKYSSTSQCDDQLSDISNDSKSLSCQGDDNMSVASDGNLEKRTLRLDDDVAFAELSAVAPEHPSPVSVLDASAYKDDEPSPVKQIATPLKDLWKLADNLPNKASETKIAKKLENIENLVQKLRRLNSSHDEARTDYIASLCENSNPDHRYISEILLASGLLLRDLSSGLAAFQLHPSGHPINPELFFVLEQTKASSSEKGVRVKSSSPDKFHRKLIFDAVNEVLAGKLGLVNVLSREPWLGPEKLARKTLNAQRLLKELCHEIEQFQSQKRVAELGFEAKGDYLKGVLCEDVMCRSENWTEFFGEVSGVVLDVERSIFKDLVDEVVRGEAADSRIKSARRRQLFSK